MSAHAADLVLESLRLGSNDPEGLASAWASSPQDGLDVLLRYEQCAPWLYKRLADRGLSDAQSDSLRAMTARSAREAAANVLAVDEQACRAVGILNEVGVPHVLLKGVARRLSPVPIPYAEDRSTADVDVLVPESAADAAQSAFLGRGYRVAYDPEATPEGHFHRLPLRDDLPIAVEVHTSTSAAVSAAEAWRRQTAEATEVETGGGWSRVPSPTELLWHALTHGLTHGPEHFRLRAMQDIACVWGAAAPLDWDRIVARLGSGEVDDEEARLWLEAAGWLAGTDVESRVGLPAPRADRLRRLLRWRLTVLRSRRLPGAIRRKLLAASTRVELGAGLAPIVGPRSVAVLARHRTASLLAGGAYRACRWWWRLSPGSRASRGSRRAES